MAKTAKKVKKQVDINTAIQKLVKKSLSTDWRLEEATQGVWDDGAYEVLFPALKAEVRRQLAASK